MANCCSPLRQRSGFCDQQNENDEEEDGLEHVVPSRIGARSRRGIHSGGSRSSSVANQQRRRQTTTARSNHHQPGNIQRSLDLLKHFVAQERRMSGRRDVKVVFIEIGELCCATKVNDKQIIFCNNFQRDDDGDDDGPPGSRPSSVPRRLSTGAEGCFRIVAAVAVDSSHLLDFLLIDESVSAAASTELEPEAEIGRLVELPASGPAAWSDCSDDSGGVRLVLGSGSVGGAGRGRLGAGHSQESEGVPRGNFKRTSLGSDYFEQFCVKCRIYLLENFQKFRSNFSIMSRVSMTKCVRSGSSG